MLKNKGEVSRNFQQHSLCTVYIGYSIFNGTLFFEAVSGIWELLYVEEGGQCIPECVMQHEQQFDKKAGLV